MTDDIKMRITTDPDFVACKRFDFSLQKILERYPDGAPNSVIAQALMISEAAVDRRYSKIILKLRALMGVEP